MTPESEEEFTRLQRYADIFKPPPVKSSRTWKPWLRPGLVRDQVKFDYQFDFLRITSDTVLVPVTIQVPRKQMSFQEKDGVDTSTVNLFRSCYQPQRTCVVQTFEDTMRTDVPASLLQQSLSGALNLL